MQNTVSLRLGRGLGIPYAINKNKNHRIINTCAGPVVRWKPDTLLVNDSTLLPKIYHLRSTKPAHYNQSPSSIKSLVEENDWRKHREKRKSLDLPVSRPLYIPIQSASLPLNNSQFSPKSVQDDEQLIDTYISAWITALRERYASSETIFDFSMWGK